MSFVSTQIRSVRDPARRWVILTGVALLHAGALYVLVTGLAGVVTFITPPPTLRAHDDPVFVPVTPPTARPTPEPSARPIASIAPPHGPSPAPQPDPTPFALPSPSVDAIGDGVPALGPIAGVVLTPTPAPSPSFAARPAIPRGGPGAWISSDDYPAQDLREGNAGVTGFRLIIGSDGHPQSCEITAPSGHPRLDAMACQLILHRANFRPAIDDLGAPTTGSYRSKVYWTIPQR